jgi:putative hydrolase
VSGVPSFGGDDFLTKMLGDLIRLMPTAKGFQWPIAHQLAASAAAADQPDPNPDPQERIRLEELSDVAAMHVADVTGMQPSPAGRTPRLVLTSRTEWARRTLETWHPVLEQLNTASAPPATPTGAAAAGGEPVAGDTAEDDEEARRLAELLGRWAGAVMPMMMAMQVGSAVGHLARNALGLYEVPVAPAHDDEILVVGANLARFAEDWSLRRDDLSLWLCVHEIAHHAVLSRPHVAARLAQLIVSHAEQLRPDTATLEALMRGANPADPSSMMDLFAEPSALSAPVDATELQALRSQLDALVATISGYAEHVTTTVATRLVGAHTPINEAMRRRRVGRGRGERVAQELFGLRLDQESVDRGASFVEGVLERSGDAQLARLWLDEASLPTPAELDAPGLWLARLELG